MKKGFSLIEMMISVFIFMLMMVAIVQIFAQQIQTYRHARSVQNDMENAQFAMNYIAKTLRTASVLGDGSADFSDKAVFNNNDFAVVEIGAGETLVVYDYSQELCVKFSFQPAGHNGYIDDALWMTNNSVDVVYDAIDECLNSANYAGSPERRLTTGNVTGTFEVAPTRYKELQGIAQTDTIGRVTTALKVLPGHSKFQRGSDPVPIFLQTTTSLRDYPSDLSF